MNIETLTSFFMWCSIINLGLFTLWIVCFKCAPDWTYRMQRMWFPISRETYQTVVYAFLASFKIVVLVFNVVPWVALRIIGS